jgi:hypothetical protein
MYTGFQAKERGESHKEKDLPCQDAVYYEQNNSGGIIAVADGHGSEKHFRSDVGSAQAVRIARDAISEFAHILATRLRDAKKKGTQRNSFFSKESRDAHMKQLERSIITRWRDAVRKHYRENPLNETERALCARLGLNPADENTQARFYGTTLIAAGWWATIWFVIQIGDGKCVIIDAQGRASFPGIDNEALGFGKTTSLCDSNAADNFREIYDLRPIKGITVATDGVTDSFIPDAYLEFHETLYADFCRDADRARSGVEKGIGVWAANGSRDDAAMAGIFETGGKG